jgi:sterol desaturase/sphingolipid hydroxylase (fatty acid hydroxylase superfamily)
MAQRKGVSLVVLATAQSAYLIFALVHFSTNGFPVFVEGRTHSYLAYLALNVLTFPPVTLFMPLFFTLVVSRQRFTERTGRLMREVWWNSLIMIPGAALVYKGLVEGFIGHFIRKLDRPVWFLVLEGAAFLVLADLWFYVTHRALHSRLLYRFHKAHHAHRAPTEAATFLALSPAEAYLSGVLMMTFPMLVMPVHAHVAIACSGIVLLCGFYIHAGAGVPALPLVNGPAQHQMHHARGRTNANYSLIFTFLDRVFGTYAAPVEPERKGDFTRCTLPPGHRPDSVDVSLGDRRAQADWQRGTDPGGSAGTLASEREGGRDDQDLTSS